MPKECSSQISFLASITTRLPVFVCSTLFLSFSLTLYLSLSFYLYLFLRASLTLSLSAPLFFLFSIQKLVLSSSHRLPLSFPIFSISQASTSLILEASSLTPSFSSTKRFLAYLQLISWYLMFYFCCALLLFVCSTFTL